MTRQEYIDFILFSKPLKHSYSVNESINDFRTNLLKKFSIEDSPGILNPPKKRFYGQFDSKNSNLFTARIKTSLQRWAKTMQPLISVTGHLINTDDSKTNVDIQFKRTNESKNQALFALVFVLIILAVLIFKVSGFLTIMSLILILLFIISTALITWYNMINRQIKYFEDYLIENE